jgi:6-phosphogluconolactonase
MPSKPEIRVQPDPEALFKTAAAEYVRLAKAAVKGSGRFTVALAGGSTPKSLYSLLASGTVPGVPWDKTYFFFADERHVLPDHPDSNFRMASEAMLSKAPVPADHVFRVPAEIPDPDTAALSYEQTLRQFFELQEDALPRFDLILLGMGPDGHTASLFPGTGALRDDENLVAANWVEKLKSWRITFTYPVLNHAANVIFMVTGAEKADALHEVLRGERDPETYPSQRVRPIKGHVLWLVDQAAAAKLT